MWVLSTAVGNMAHSTPMAETTGSATGEYDHYFNRREPYAYHGTGDIFSATAVGGIMRGMSLKDAFCLAVDFTLHCIEVTRTDPQAAWYGVEFERALPMLTARAAALGER